MNEIESEIPRGRQRWEQHLQVGAVEVGALYPPVKETRYPVELPTLRVQREVETARAGADRAMVRSVEVPPLGRTAVQIQRLPRRIQRDPIANPQLLPGHKALHDRAADDGPIGTRQ